MKRHRSKGMTYIKLESLEALARLACNFDYTNSSIMCAMSGSAYRIFVIADRIGDTPIAYYINMPRKEAAISYTYPSSEDQQENAHFVEEGQRDHIQSRQYMDIIHIDGIAYAEAKGMPRRKIGSIRMSSANDIVIAAIRKSAIIESLCSLYTFTSRGRRIICGFDLIDELKDDTTILYYAASDSLTGAKFARYKYSENKVDFTDYVGEHSYMYAKIIPLAEPFPFFNMPD